MLRLLIDNTVEAWNGTCTLTDEEAIKLFQRYLYNIVLLTNGIEEVNEQKLRSLFQFQHPGLIIKQHYGGGNGLLSNEIEGALQLRTHQNKPAIHTKDGL